MAGRGTYTFAKGGSLECDFADDRAQGKGVLKLPDGTTYKGAFVDGAMHGRGVLRANGATYKGAFAANMFHGKGKLTFPSGDTYSGAFAKHAFHGKGVYAWRSGKRLAGAYGQREGEWEDGEPHGAGVFTSSNSEYVEGDFHRGRYVDPDKETPPASGLGSLFGGGSASSKHHLP
ncbi:translation initiation factor IF-2 [Aureococcus anophagefferens]|nr:translation initiation factor IF-2 [Aureococcus anophagefferens]